MRALLVVIGLTGVACRPDAKAAAPPAVDPPLASVPADTLLHQTPDGYQIWFAEGREARDSAGAECYERSVEIRRGDTVVKVPLLFTTDPPTLLDRGTLRAALMRGCRVIGIYRVDLATGRPTKIGR